MKSVLKKFVLRFYTTIKNLFVKQPTRVTANIVELAESELLKGRTALITGGTSGIGFSIANAMLKAGATAVVITGRTEERCRKAVEDLLAVSPNRNGRVFYEVMDIRNVENFNENFEHIKKQLGDKKIDILCNNAGVQGATFGLAKEEDFDNVMETNYKGAFFLSQLVAHYMIDNKIQGNILNIASSSSLRPTNSAYSLSKACIKELTAGMAKFLIPYGIVVNGIAPGPTATPLMNKDIESTIEHPSNPMGRYALPEEIANMAVILTSGMGRTVVGSIVYMTGGAGVITFDDSKYKF